MEVVMDSVGAYEAKTHLPRLLDRVAMGERIVITRHGVPVAVLQPVGRAAREDTREVIRALRAFRKGRMLANGSLKEMIVEGRS